MSNVTSLLAFELVYVAMDLSVLPVDFREVGQRDQ